jgi:predicted AAA+ superfamily ATPase
LNNQIERPIYLERIKPHIGKNIIKVLVGQRRVGKSSLLLQLMDIIGQQDPTSNIVYINKELFEHDSLRNYKDLMKSVNAQTIKG